MLPAAEEKGSLLIQTEPGTEVVWDGVSLAKTDEKGRLSIEEIPLGQYNLVLHKNGFRKLRREVEVKRGQVSLVLPLEAMASSQVSPKPSPRAPRVKLPRAEKPKTDSASKPGVLPPEFKVKEKGDVPVWPASPQPQTPVRSTTNNLFFWMLLFIVAAVLALMATMRRRPREQKPPPGSTILPADLEEDLAAMDEDMPTEKPVSFLNELKIREELLEQGVEIVKTKEKRTVIDLDASSVREVEDKS